MTNSTHTPEQGKPTLRQWVQGARLRTLPLAIAPVILGSASAWWREGFEAVLALLALVVACALQIGVNFANDYSDGIRGTDAHRVGPARLTGSGAVRPDLVKAAAFTSFGVAIAAGGALVLVTQLWWLLGLGAAALWAAWTYTGGRSPYGYRGFGEIVVFIFFGLIATVGTAWIQLGYLPWESWLTGSAAGFFASAVLLINNLRDRDTDATADKRTLAVVLGRRGSQIAITAMLLAPYGIVWALSLLFSAASFVFISAIITAVIITIIWYARSARDLIVALQLTTLNALVYAVGLARAIAL